MNRYLDNLPKFENTKMSKDPKTNIITFIHNYYTRDNNFNIVTINNIRDILYNFLEEQDLIDINNKFNINFNIININNINITLIYKENYNLYSFNGTITEKDEYLLLNVFLIFGDKNKNIIKYILSPFKIEKKGNYYNYGK